MVAETRRQQMKFPDLKSQREIDNEELDIVVLKYATIISFCLLAFVAVVSVVA